MSGAVRHTEWEIASKPRVSAREYVDAAEYDAVVAALAEAREQIRVFMAAAAVPRMALGSGT